MENHGTSTGNVKVLPCFSPHIGFNSVSTDNFPIFGETWGNWKGLVMGWRWMEDRGLGGSFILWGAKQLLGGVQHHGQARNGAGTLHGGCAACEPNGWGTQGHLARQQASPSLQWDVFLICQCFHSHCNQVRVLKTPLGNALLVTLPVFGENRSSALLKTICAMVKPRITKVCFLNKRDWSSLHN